MMSFSSKAKKPYIAKSSASVIYQSKISLYLLSTNSNFQLNEKKDNVEDDDIGEKEDDDSRQDYKIHKLKNKQPLGFTVCSIKNKPNPPLIYLKKRYISFHELKINC